jgi:hypothetical protein
MDVLLNWLEWQDNYKRDRQAIQDAFNAQNRCREYLEVEFLKSQEDINTVINTSAPLQQKQGWNQQRSNYQGKYPDNYSKQPSLRELILEQAKINDNIAKKLVANDKILENINIKIDSFSSTIKD